MSFLPQEKILEIPFSVASDSPSWDYSAWDYNIGLNKDVWSIVGIALSMLLAFKTSLALDRYWEVADHCASMITDCRNLATSVMIFTDSSDDITVKEARQNCFRLIKAFLLLTITVFKSRAVNQYPTEV